MTLQPPEGLDPDHDSPEHELPEYESPEYGDTRPPGGGTRLLTAALGALLLLGVAAGIAVLAFGLATGEPAEYRIVIPAGTGEQIDAGEPVALIPADLRLDTGTTFVVVNRDDRTHEVGPFSVRAGETLTHRFDHAGVYIGICTVHPSGEVRITVT